MTKIDKLKEINKTLTNILIQMETYMFIENISDTNKNNLDNSKNAIVSKKQ